MRIDDHSFSEQLRLHASSLDLKTICAVGDWDYGQSIRRAKADSYFYDLSLKNFYPLGLNHPLMIRSLATDGAPQEFNSSLSSKLSGLKLFKWVVLDAKDYRDLKSKRLIHEYDSFSINSIWGLSVFETLEFETFSVRLSDGSLWVCSSLELPASSQLIHHSWLNLFLTPDVLGPEGRLASVHKLLIKVFNPAEIQGLTLRLRGEVHALSQRGILAEKYSESEVSLHFPISVLSSDVEKIYQIIASKELLC